MDVQKGNKCVYLSLDGHWSERERRKGSSSRPPRINFDSLQSDPFIMTGRLIIKIRVWIQAEVCEEYSPQWPVSDHWIVYGIALGCCAWRNATLFSFFLFFPLYKAIFLHTQSKRNQNQEKWPLGTHWVTDDVPKIWKYSSSGIPLYK